LAFETHFHAESKPLSSSFSCRPIMSSNERHVRL
jgi:hypothetical protein